ncbi:lytic transglycosylase domain-containing protein [Polynucleobacter sp. JS-Safj-400b-B2]|nr:lytic transglycosylase domain-containing protein [Polynucleobacter sp. JS-Safj-400b-B2]MBU3626719.1 lytic transglycosylase domain-containing protein [Polynucleobacter sp. JS-Safj-400b-B2]
MGPQNLVQCLKTVEINKRNLGCQEVIRNYWLAEPNIRKAAKEVGMEPALLHAVVAIESNYNASALSNKGARGLTQVLPGTATEVGVHPDYLWNSASSSTAGARYLAQQWRTFGDWRLALAAYNAGPGAVRNYRGIPPYPATIEYVNNVLWVYNEMKAGGL